MASLTAHPCAPATPAFVALLLLATDVARWKRVSDAAKIKIE
jgi:hypothetical protein